MAQLCHGLTVDLGCGKGPYTHLFEDLIGIDLSSEALKEYEAPQVQASVEGCLPFRDCVFDSALASELLEHVDDEKTVGDALRVLRPGGVFCFSIPNGLRGEWHLPSWQSPDHRRLYTPEKLRRLLGDVDFHSYGGEPLKELRLLGTKKKRG